MKLNKIIFILISLVLVSCMDQEVKDTPKKTAANIQIQRFEKEMFGVPIAGLEAHLKGIKTQYDCALLNVYPDDPNYMTQICDMAQDRTMREIYDSIQSKYADLSWLEKDLTQALGRLKRVDNRINCNKIITFASGTFDYANRVAADRNSILIAIDQYTVPMFKHYGYFQLPMYLVHLCDSQYIASDCIAAVAQQHVAIPETEMNLLDYMIAEGKTTYLQSIALPKTEDSILLRYTSEQMEWIEDNEQKAWAYLIQNNLLYEKDFNKIHNFIEDAPKTNCFGNESAPRIAAYFGLRIVRRYMKGHDINTRELLDNTNSQSILRLSGYKPERR